ncbi:PQQ-binding-like beta-propeller repeat protein [Aporhodopirellula aestuarii]|uniref:PQQ-like beta-propeller repeat protein n=1 Tax=Aporhodopirellula aestuarii TaxID=2950107 RepID=A0ABT0U8I5_9BACT|nr:PQQ-binding-like beta-propeller repeat protein [Aporhodopirellula aestuarii]MCM2373203.1 PQQ-like beta-propeller repeat protein [Aporhodopirellula aestuarii]
MFAHPHLFKSNAVVVAISLVAISIGLQPIAHADDWSGWMGDSRDGVYREEGIIDQIPDAGLTVLWRTPIAGGYAGPSVVDNRVFVFDYEKQSGEAFNSPNERASVTGKERLTALDAATGQVIWQHEYECAYSISYPAGPRCTPTVDGDRVYSLGSEGDLHCVDVKTGEVVWSKSLKKDFGATVAIWGYASHPLVAGDLLYTMVGGEGQGIVAFDKLTGEVRWKALSTPPGYCAPTIIEFGGRLQLIAFNPTGVDALDPLTGESFWHVDLSPMFEMSIARPMLEGDMLYASGIRNEAVMIKLDAQSPGASELWRGERDTAVYCSNSTPMFVDGVIYGTDCNTGNMIAVDAKTSDRLWTSFLPTRPDEKRFVKHGTAFITRIGDTDRYLLFSEIGDLIMARLTRSGYEELGRYHAIEPTGEAFGRDVVWTHPAYANRTAYIRNDREIIAVSLSAAKD